MPLVLTLQHTTPIPVEVDGLRLETVRTQTPDGILATLVQHGNRELPLGEFFSASGSAADDNEVVWQGDLGHVKQIGARLASGRMRVEGNAGMHLGAQMTGGEILVSGNVSDWCGAEMRGGRITVKGNAGDFLGAAYRGSRRGMNSGEILVHGSAGNEIGHTMRRGLIAVGGRAGDAAGYRMIAGSILLFGESGVRPGAGMRRGTIAFLSERPEPQVLPTFEFACRSQMVFLRVYLRHLESLGFPVPPGAMDAPYDRWCGDMLELGKGELLVRQAV